MTRFLLALRCFFAVLLRSQLPLEAMALLLPAGRKPLHRAPDPPAEAPPPVAQPSATAKTDHRAETDKESPAASTAVSAANPSGSAALVPPAELAAAGAAAPAAPSIDAADQRRRGAVQVLAVLQREGRLLDFLSENIDSYSDGQIGAAVRDIHRGCRKALAEHIKVAPIRPEPDEATVRIAAGHDASQVRLVGQVTGRPPFEGTLRHHGWRSTQINLPDIPAGHDPTVICPAEVEIGG